MDDREYSIMRICDKIYPLTIVTDRYSGVFSGGRYIAWNLDPDEIPDETFGDDNEHIDFWSYDRQDYENKYGTGRTIEQAVETLYLKLKEQGEDNEEI